MEALFGWEWGLDGWIVLTAMLSAVSASLLGNYLVLRRMSMLGDAITHAVLPGLAIAFFISHSRSSPAMFVGAVIAGVLTAFLSEWIRRTGRVDEGASMGVVFTSLFALGLVLIVQAADRVDLDPNCVFYGAIELVPFDTIDIAGLEIPRATLQLAIVTVLNIVFVSLFFKELLISSFDAALATTTGFSATFMHYLLMTMVAVTAVASFESVGSVLVVAMFIVPPATAYLLSDRLRTMIGLSVLFAIAAAIGGHLSASIVPRWFGFQSTHTAGMMAVAAGFFMGLVILFGPRHGIVIKYLQQRRLAQSILADDVVGVLFRIEEHAGTPPTFAAMLDLLLCSPWALRSSLRTLMRQGAIQRLDQRVTLTEQGRIRAQNLVRSHRLWEQYLQERAGIDPTRVHAPAENFEHYTDPELRERLDAETDTPSVDPHGRPIPVERVQSPLN